MNLHSIREFFWGSSTRRVRFLQFFLGAVTLSAFSMEYSDYRLTQWFFTYDHEFIKRGMIGSILGSIVSSPTLGLLSALSLVMVTAIALLSAAISFPAMKGSHSQGLSYLALLFFASSATIQATGFDAGRLDHFCLLATLSSALLIAGGFHPGWVMVLGICSHLIHEAAILLTIPILLGLLLQSETRGQSRWIWSLLLALGGVGLTVWTIKAGGLESVPYETYLEELQQRADFEINPYSVQVLYYDFQTNLDFIRDKMLTPKMAKRFLETIVTEVPQMICLSLLVGAVWTTARMRGDTGKVALLGTGALAPLLLLTCAIDYFRWFAFAFTNVYVALFFLCRCENYASSLNEAAHRFRHLFVLTALWSLVNGPIAVCRNHRYLHVFENVINRFLENP